MTTTIFMWAEILLLVSILALLVGIMVRLGGLVAFTDLQMATNTLIDNMAVIAQGTYDKIEVVNDELKEINNELKEIKYTMEEDTETTADRFEKRAAKDE